MRIPFMTSVEKPVAFIFYDVGDRKVSLDKNMVEKYSDIVCPVTEKFLSGMVKVFGKGCTDSIMSYKIGLDMARELEEYA